MRVSNKRAFEAIIENIEWSTKYLQAYHEGGMEAADKVNEEWEKWIENLKEEFKPKKRKKREKDSN